MSHVPSKKERKMLVAIESGNRKDRRHYVKMLVNQLEREGYLCNTIKTIDWSHGEFNGLKNISPYDALSEFGKRRGLKIAEMQRSIESMDCTVVDSSLLTTLIHRGEEIYQCFDRQKLALYMRIGYILEYTTYKVPRPDVQIYLAGEKADAIPDLFPEIDLLPPNSIKDEIARLIQGWEERPDLPIHIINMDGKIDREIQEEILSIVTREMHSLERRP